MSREPRTRRHQLPSKLPARMLLLALLPLVLAATPAASGAAVGSPPSPWIPTLVTTMSPLPEMPTGFPRHNMPRFAADSGRVAWSDSDGHDEEIYLYDAATGVTEQLTDNDLDDTGATLAGSRLAYRRHTGDWMEIVLRDLSTGVQRIVSSAPAVAAPHLAGDFLAWTEDTDYGPRPDEPYAPPALTDLRVYDMATDTTFAVGTTGSFDLDGKHLIFADRGSPPRIVLYDLATHSARIVSHSAYGANQPNVAGGLATWVEGSGQTVGIVVYDIAADSIRTVARAWGGSAQPKTDGGYVVWADHNGSTLEVKLFDSATGAVRVVSDTRFMSGSPVIGEGRVAWGQDDEHDAEIYLLDLATGVRTQVSNSRYQDQLPKLSGDTIAWWQYDPGGVDSRIYVSVASGEAPDPGFIDLSGTHPYRTAVAALSAAGVVSGYGGARGPEFRPDAPVLRAQLAKMIVGYFHLPVAEGMDVPFGDLGPDDPDNLYPHQYAAALAAAGIAKGTAPGVFSPYEPVSRAQAVTMLVRAVQGMRPEVLSPANLERLSPGGDFDPTHAPNMRLAAANGILAAMVGYGSQWAVWEPMTRAQVAEMLWNLSGLDPVADGVER